MDSVTRRILLPRFSPGCHKPSFIARGVDLLDVLIRSADIQLHREIDEYPLPISGTMRSEDRKESKISAPA
jgi:hypothetical protein